MSIEVVGSCAGLGTGLFIAHRHHPAVRLLVHLSIKIVADNNFLIDKTVELFISFPQSLVFVSNNTNGGAYSIMNLNSIAAATYNSL